MTNDSDLDGVLTHQPPQEGDMTRGEFNARVAGAGLVGIVSAMLSACHVKIDLSSQPKDKCPATCYDNAIPPGDRRLSEYWFKHTIRRAGPFVVVLYDLGSIECKNSQRGAEGDMESRDYAAKTMEIMKGIFKNHAQYIVITPSDDWSFVKKAYCDPRKIRGLIAKKLANRRVKKLTGFGMSDLPGIVVYSYGKPVAYEGLPLRFNDFCEKKFCRDNVKAYIGMVRDWYKSFREKHMKKRTEKTELPSLTHG